MKIVKKTAVLQLMLAAALLVSVSMRVQGETMLSVHVPDVGQGLCTAAESDGHWILYDGGGAPSAAFVVSKLARMGAEKLDLVIASHYDDDHIGIDNCTYSLSYDDLGHVRHFLFESTPDLSVGLHIHSGG